MIIGKIKPGSGIGDSLFSYIATRVRADDLGVDFGFVGKEFFKGQGWMDLDWGKPVDLKYTIDKSGDLILEDESKTFIVNTPYYNPEINFIPDGSVIDGYGAQDERYWQDLPHELYDTEFLEIPNDVCIINIRGGEYKNVPELFLPKSYWDAAIAKMKQINPNMKFEIHTDDLELAQAWFPEYKAISDIKQNWLSLRSAMHAIISNSAFAIIPRHLVWPTTTIAPKFWAGRNVGEWRRPGNYYKKFTYL